IDATDFLKLIPINFMWDSSKPVNHDISWFLSYDFETRVDVINWGYLQVILLMLLAAKGFKERAERVRKGINMEWIQANSGPHVNDVALTGVCAGLQCIEIKAVAGLGFSQNTIDAADGFSGHTNHCLAHGFEDFDRQAMNIDRITCSFAQAVNIDVICDIAHLHQWHGHFCAFVYSDCIPYAGSGAKKIVETGTKVQTAEDETAVNFQTSSTVTFQTSSNRCLLGVHIFAHMNKISVMEALDDKDVASVVSVFYRQFFSLLCHFLLLMCGYRKVLPHQSFTVASVTKRLCEADRCRG
ncbi:hypothetical protein Tco_1302403, partial [Tanacetum coccineum]